MGSSHILIQSSLQITHRFSLNPKSIIPEISHLVFFVFVFFLFFFWLVCSRETQLSTRHKHTYKQMYICRYKRCSTYFYIQYSLQASSLSLPPHTYFECSFVPRQQPKRPIAQLESPTSGAMTVVRCRSMQVTDPFFAFLILSRCEGDAHGRAIDKPAPAPRINDVGDLRVFWGCAV